MLSWWPPAGGLTQCGRDYVTGGCARELAGLPGEPPRLFVVTRAPASYVLLRAIAPAWNERDCVD